MASQGGLKHAATEPSQLGNKRERRRGPTGRAAALRRAPSDSDCSGETASLSADSAERTPRIPPPSTRSNKSRSRSFYSRRRGSEWEVLEGLKDGQRFEKRPEVFNGYLHKKRKWPLKGWHKRFFVIDGGILVYARSPTDVARGRLHGSVDVGLSVISAKQRRRRIDIDADEFIYHLRAKTPDVYRTWLTVLKAHRLYRQHLLTFGARESVPKIHAPLEDLPPTDTSSRHAVFLISSTSYTSTSVEEESSITPNDSVIYLTMEGNKEMYSVLPKPRVPDVSSKSTGKDRFGYKTMGRCIKTNMLYKNCYTSGFGENIGSKYCHFPVLCSTEFSFASKDSAKPKFSEKRYMCTHHVKMHENSSRAGSYCSVKKSKKCTNVKRYQMINTEPKLPALESQCIILKKYMRNPSVKEMKDVHHNVDNYRVVIRKRHKPQKNTESIPSVEGITKTLLTSVFGVTDSIQHVEHIKASVNRAVKNLYRGPDNYHPVKQLFKSLLEFYLKNKSVVSAAKETDTHDDNKNSKNTSGKKPTKDVYLTTSNIETTTKGTQIQELLDQLSDAKEKLLNAIYKSETIQKDVSTVDQSASAIHPFSKVSKEMQIQKSDKQSTGGELTSSNTMSISSHASVHKNIEKNKHEYHNLSRTFSVESELAPEKHKVMTVNPLAAIVKTTGSHKSEEIETIIQNTIYTCKTVDQHRDPLDYNVVPRTPRNSKYVFNKKSDIPTSSNSDQDSVSSNKEHIVSHTKETQIIQDNVDTDSDVHQCSCKIKTYMTPEKSKESNKDDYLGSTTDQSSDYGTFSSPKDTLSQKLFKSFSTVINSMHSYVDTPKLKHTKPIQNMELLSKRPSLNQMLKVISSVFTELNKIYSLSHTKLTKDSAQKSPINSGVDTDSLPTKDNSEESNTEYDIHNILMNLKKAFSDDKKKERPHKVNYVAPTIYPKVDKFAKVVMVDVNESNINKTPLQLFQAKTHCFIQNKFIKERDYSSVSIFNSESPVSDVKETEDLKPYRLLKSKKNSYTAKIKNVRRCIPKPRSNFEKRSDVKPLPKYMDETFIQLLLENMNLILNNLPDNYKDLYAKLSEKSDYSVEIDLLRKMYKNLIASTDKEAQYDSKIQLLKDTIDVFTEVSNIILKRQVGNKSVSASTSGVDITEEKPRIPTQPSENLNLDKVFLHQNLSAKVLTLDGISQTSKKQSQVNNNIDVQKACSSKTEQTISSFFCGNLNLMNEFSAKKSLISSSLHREFLEKRSSNQYCNTKNEKTYDVKNIEVEKNTVNNSDAIQLNRDISTISTLHKFSSTMLSPKSFPERYLKPSKTASGIVIDTNEEIIHIEELQKVTDYEEPPKTYLVVISSTKKRRRKKHKKPTSIRRHFLSITPQKPVKISTEIQTSKSLKKKKKLLKNWTIFRNAATSDCSYDPPLRDKNSDINTIYRCTSETSYLSGLISPTSPPIRGPQAGFVSGTPGGRLASWIIESGGPLENASKELGQAQLSVQQLQRLLDTLELQQQVHHDTDVSLEGASPNVKKDRRKFGLRKKKSNSKCASVELAPPQHIDPSNSHMALSTLTAPPSPGGGASSAPNSAASLPIACAAARPQSLPGAESICGAGGPASLTSLTPDHQLREDFTILAKDLVASLKSIVGTLVCERGRLRAAMDAGDTTSSPNGAMVAALRTNLSAALLHNSELRNRLSRIHDASDLAEISSMGHNSDPIARQFQASLSYSSSCVSASEFFDAEEHEEDDAKQEIIAADETGVIELDGDSSSEVGSLSSEEGSASSDNSDGALLSAEQVTLRLNENGHEPGTLKSAGWTRRKRLPCPRPTPGGPSLWNLLYKNIGKDLSQISMPVTINEPLNMLQRLCEELEYSELLDAAAECRSPIERMALIAAFAVSAYAAAAHRAASKPFNPLLGETYECVRDDKAFRFIAEQVSHHPPISACHAESPRWCMWQEARIKTKFWGKSMEFQPAGRVHVRLLTTGDHYSWNKVTTCVHNLFGGQRWVDQYGDMHITCHGTDISSKLNFIKASSWSTTRHEVRGAVSQPSTGARLRLQGRWSEALHAGEPPAARCLWRPGAMPPEHELYYGFTRFAMELNELEPGMRELLPHTDTRLRPDQRALEEGDVEAAEQYKHQLEQSQRERRRDSPEHQPRWFRKSQENGEEMWVFGGEYWKAREAGFIENVAPNIW